MFSHVSVRACSRRYILVPAYFYFSEVKARALFHVQNVVAGKWRKLDQVQPSWRREWLSNKEGTTEPSPNDDETDPLESTRSTVGTGGADGAKD